MKTRFCESCGMPLMNLEDFANGDIESHFCCCCVDSKGNIKPVEEIFWSGVKFFTSQMNYDEITAEKLMRKNMKCQTFRKDKNDFILTGEMVSDEEFLEMMKKCNALKK